MPKRIKKTNIKHSNANHSTIAKGAVIIDSEIATNAKITGGSTVAEDAKIFDSEIASNAEIENSEIAKNAEIINSRIANNSKIKVQLTKAFKIKNKYAIAVAVISLIIIVIGLNFIDNKSISRFIYSIAGLGGIWSLLNLLFNFYKTFGNKENS